ncbi:MULTISPECIES: bifunctional aminoglycoside phosphotransferase/ATP-binding protein [Nitrincola]|uniref:Polynucleotide kinase n=1 Tax=Nitrincola nitratireducens TaxID=1229521 RepID=W9VF71_9GAMM|nr:MULTISPECIES: bifunctional aminoglycoside phosphotransferase/ATP-binding protein [Nitrincola]EXJ09305.1 hypothetical protein D791_03787 [Nitrincola nitratireducens]
MLKTLIHSLMNPDRFPHPCSHIEVIETHISWLLLTGTFAYKIKKPVNFGFLDFTSLEQRRVCCEEELRLNQRLAPDIYQDVIAISGTHSDPKIGDASNPIEYAVKMAQFDPEHRLDRQLAKQLFEARWIDTLALQIADFHQRIPIVAQDSPWGEPETLWQLISDNYEHCNQNPQALEDSVLLLRLHTQTAQDFKELAPLLIERKKQGHVRECHGDLHLANITLFHDQLRLFDCIEFNLQFRWIDTLSDLAFLLMDLEANHQPRWANRCLNLYLEKNGDYGGIRLLNLYKAYRSMVRAKVALLGEHPDTASFRHYLHLTERYCTPPPPALYLMHGVSGSGKSYLSKQLVEEIGAIRIRSDVERKRLHHQLSLQGEEIELYSADMNTRTFHRLRDLAEQLLRSGQTVVVDATFIRRITRKSYIELAQRLKLPVRIISCTCKPHLVEARLVRRNEEGKDPSDADIHIMHQQVTTQQPLTEDEKRITLPVDTEDDEAIEQLLSQLRAQNLLLPQGGR